MYLEVFDNWVDLAILAVIIVGTLYGLSQGLVRQAFILGSLYISSVLALQYYAPVSNWAAKLWPYTEESSRTTFGMVIVFVFSFLILNLVSYFLYEETRLPSMAVVDQGGGALAGAVGGWILAAIIVNLLGLSFRFAWGGWETLEGATQFHFNSSVFVPMLYSQMPALLETVRPWLPTGLQVPFII